jgi:hypothetical protein
MVYQIYSIGDAEMMTMALNAVASVFNSSVLGYLVAAAFLLGVVVMSGNYLLAIKYELNTVFFGLLLYLMMFVPKVTVGVEDVYTGQNYTVAHVPIGLAAPMSFVTSAGYNVERIFETVFTLPEQASMTQNGYMNSLKTIELLHKKVTYNNNTAMSDVYANGELGTTLNNYLNTCVHYDMVQTITAQEITRESLMKAASVLDGIKNTFVNIDLMVNLPGSTNGWVQMSCANAYNAIHGYLTSSAGIDGIDNYILGQFGMDTNTDNTTAEAILSNSFSALSVEGIDAQTYMMNAVLASYIFDGPSAILTRPAQETMNLQWATEQSLFNNIERPILAFFELFTVGVTPIIAVAVVMGAVGLGILGHYLRLIIWIALWSPLMALCNLYIIVTTSRILAKIVFFAGKNGAGLGSMVLHDTVFSQLETQLATGGMLSAAVPMLSMALVWGGSVAASGLVSRMESSATSADTSAAAPKAMNVNPAAQIESVMSGGVNTPMKETGKPSTTWSSGSAKKRAISSARDEMVSASDSFSDTVSRMNQTAKSNGISATVGSSAVSQYNKSVKSGEHWSSNVAGKTSHGHSFTDAEGDMVSRVIDGKASFGGGKLLSASISAGLQSRHGWDKKEADQAGEDFQRGFETGKLGEISSTGSETASQTQGVERNQTFSELDSMSKNLSSSAQRMRQSSDKYSEMAAKESSIGKNTTIPLEQLATQLTQPATRGKVIAAFSDAERKAYGSGKPESVSQALKQSNDLLSRNGLHIANPSDHEAVSKFLALDQLNPEASDKIVESLGFGGQGDNGLNADSHRGIAGKGLMTEEAANAGRQQIGSGPVNDVAGNQAPGSGAKQKTQDLYGEVGALQNNVQTSNDNIHDVVIGRGKEINQASEAHRAAGGFGYINEEVVKPSFDNFSSWGENNLKTEDD